MLQAVFAQELKSTHTRAAVSAQLGSSDLRFHNFKNIWERECDDQEVAAHATYKSSDAILWTLITQSRDVRTSDYPELPVACITLDPEPMVAHANSNGV